MHKNIIAVMFLLCISGQIFPGKNDARRLKRMQEINIDDLSSLVCGCYVRFAILRDYLEEDDLSSDKSVEIWHKFFKTLIVDEIEKLAIPLGLHSKKIRKELKDMTLEEKIAFLRKEAQNSLEQYQKVIFAKASKKGFCFKGKFKTIEAGV